MSLFKQKLNVFQMKKQPLNQQTSNDIMSRNSKRHFLSLTSSRTRISYNQIQSQQTILSRLQTSFTQNKSLNKNFWENSCDKMQNICHQQIVFHEKQEINQTQTNLPTRSSQGSIHSLKAKNKEYFISKPSTPMSKLKQSQFIDKKILLSSLQTSKVERFNQAQLKFFLNHQPI